MSRRCGHQSKDSWPILSPGGYSILTTAARTAPTATHTTPRVDCSSSRSLGVLNNVHALNAVLAHKPLDPFAVHRQAQPEPQLGGHPRRPLAEPGLLVDFPDHLDQLPVLRFPRRFRARGPVAVSRP